MIGKALVLFVGWMMCLGLCMYLFINIITNSKVYNDLSRIYDKAIIKVEHELELPEEPTKGW